MAVPDRSPRLPCDSQDDHCDSKRDQWVAQLEAERHQGCAEDNAQADERIHPRVIAVCDQRRALKSAPGPRSYSPSDALVAVTQWYVGAIAISNQSI
jgi:hypothetical protein